VNLVAEARGIFRVDTDALDRLNRLKGITLATLRQHTLVREGQIAVTVKIVPFAVPASCVEAAQLICGAGMSRIDPLLEKHVGLVLQGTTPSRERVIAEFVAPLSERIERLGSRVAGFEFVTLDDELGEEKLAATIRRHAERGTDVVILAGETAIVDERDIVPRAIGAAGGSVEAYGAPVDPGNLLLLGYAGEKMVVVGAPGCARSPKLNVIDRVLPRLLAGERLTANDIAAMGHGGLLADIPERGAPRSERS
jgi:molybdopterin biosynthesis enzyme